jgi:putative hemolysin
MMRIILAMFFILLLFQASAVAVMGPQGVANTAHNLSSQDGGTLDYYVSDNEDEICIFCHTPHGGSLDGPLWNRSSPGNSTFTHYTTATLDSIFLTSATAPVLSPRLGAATMCRSSTFPERSGA